MRVRHRLKLDEENNFDVLTSDSVMGIFDQSRAPCCWRSS